MPNLVKFEEIVEYWDEERSREYRPAYVDIDSIQYITQYRDDNNADHCSVMLKNGWTVGLKISMDHLAELVNKAAEKKSQDLQPS